LIDLRTEREQNRNQATADITRPSPSSSSSNNDQSRVSVSTNGSLVIDTSNSFPHAQIPADSTPPAAGAVNVATQTHDADPTSSGSADDKPLTSIGECCDNVANERHGKKRHVVFNTPFVL